MVAFASFEASEHTQSGVTSTAKMENVSPHYDSNSKTPEPCIRLLCARGRKAFRPSKAKGERKVFNLIFFSSFCSFNIITQYIWSASLLAMCVNGLRPASPASP